MSVFDKIIQQKLQQLQIPQQPKKEFYQNALAKYQERHKPNQETIKKDQEIKNEVESDDDKTLPNNIKIGETMLSREDLARAVKQKKVLENRLKGEPARERAQKMREAKERKRLMKIEEKKEKDKKMFKNLEEKQKKHDLVKSLAEKVEQLSNQLATLKQKTPEVSDENNSDNEN